jgi:transcription elongation factor Elf1
MAVSAQERLYLLSQVNQLAQTQLNQLWTQADQLSNTEFAAFVVEAFPQIADPFVSMSGQLAASWFELSDPASDYIASVAPLPAVEKLSTSAEWALGATGDAGRDRLSGTLQRAVFDGARDTTMVNVEQTKSRWAVHARATACPWCRMMATRGAVYKSGASALAACHDHGHCVAMEIRGDETYNPPDYVSQWADEYLKARANAGSGDPKAIQAAWRQILTAEA